MWPDFGKQVTLWTHGVQPGEEGRELCAIFNTWISISFSVDLRFRTIQIARRQLENQKEKHPTVDVMPLRFLIKTGFVLNLKPNMWSETKSNPEHFYYSNLLTSRPYMWINIPTCCLEISLSVRSKFGLRQPNIIDGRAWHIWSTKSQRLLPAKNVKISVKY